MKISARLNEKVIQAVRVSMQLEGDQSSPSPAIKTQAKTIMDQNRIHVMAKAGIFASEPTRHQDEGDV